MMAEQSSKRVNRYHQLSGPWLGLYIAMFFFISNINGFDVKHCKTPLGMESGDIADEQLTATSSHGPSVSPIHARLNGARGNGAWCPARRIEAGIEEFIEVDLLKVHVITQVSTQGRHDHHRGHEFMREYTIKYLRPTFTKWKSYKRWDGRNIFKANDETNNVVKLRLDPAIEASKIRIYPHSVYMHPVCMRFELYGCLEESPILSYTMPISGGIFGDFNDTFYDGSKDDHKLYGGLGRLTDRVVGADHFTTDLGHGKGTGWIGFKSSSFPNKYVEIVFEFDGLRKVKQIDIYTNNYVSKDVQIFQKAIIFAIINNTLYIDEPIIYRHVADTSVRARNVSISCQKGLIGHFVKIRLYFVRSWIMISEVYFTSEPFRTNIADKYIIKTLGAGDDIPLIKQNDNITLDGAGITTKWIDIKIIIYVIIFFLFVMPLFYMLYFFFLKKNRRQYSSRYNDLSWLVRYNRCENDDLEYNPNREKSEDEIFNDPGCSLPKETITIVSKSYFRTNVMKASMLEERVNIKDASEGKENCYDMEEHGYDEPFVQRCSVPYNRYNNDEFENNANIIRTEDGIVSDPGCSVSEEERVKIKFASDENEYDNIEEHHYEEPIV